MYPGDSDHGFAHLAYTNDNVHQLSFIFSRAAMMSSLSLVDNPHVGCPCTSSRLSDSVTSADVSRFLIAFLISIVLLVTLPSCCSCSRKSDSSSPSISSMTAAILSTSAARAKSWRRLSSAVSVLSTPARAPPEP